LYLKTDKISEPVFRARNLAPFSYKRGGKVVNLSYFAAPDGSLDDPDDLAQWAKLALASARRARPPARD
jgi:DNA transformation protein